MVAVALAGWRQMAPLLAKEGLSFYRLLALFLHIIGGIPVVPAGNGDIYYVGSTGAVL